MLIVALLGIGFYLFATTLVLQQFFTTPTHTPRRVLMAAWPAIILHMLALGMTIIQAQSVQNLSVINVASLVALLINIGLTIISQRQNSWILLPFAYAFAVVLLFSNSVTPSHYLTSLGDRPGLVIHIALALLSYAMMSIASLFALLQVYLNYQLKQRRKLNLHNVPPLLRIEKQLVRLLQIGGVLLTLSISSGFLFLDNMLAPSNLDKVGLSVIAWCIYATLLWGHYYRGWRGQRLTQQKKKPGRRPGSKKTGWNGTGRARLLGGANGLRHRGGCGSGGRSGRGGGGFRGGRGGGTGLRGGAAGLGLLLLDHGGAFADALAQVGEFGAPDAALAVHFDADHPRGVGREDALDPFAVADRSSRRWPVSRRR